MPQSKISHASEMLDKESRISNHANDTSRKVNTAQDAENTGLENKDFQKLLANQTVTSWCKWASMAGFIPVPAMDIVTITSVQTLMIKELCAIYCVTFKKEVVSAVITSLTASTLSTFVSSKLASTLLNPIPIIGTTLGAISLPAISYCTTRALGDVFIKHFETNDSLDNMSAENYENFFKQTFTASKQMFKKKPSFSTI